MKKINSKEMTNLIKEEIQETKEYIETLNNVEEINKERTLIEELEKKLEIIKKLEEMVNLNKFQEERKEIEKSYGRFNDFEFTEEDDYLVLTFDGEEVDTLNLENII